MAYSSASGKGIPCASRLTWPGAKNARRKRPTARHGKREFFAACAKHGNWGAISINVSLQLCAQMLSCQEQRENVSSNQTLSHYRRAT